MEFRISEKLTHTVPEDLFGLFFEDINYAADGGLYAELLENRNFEALDVRGDKGDYFTVPDFGYAWSSVDGARVRFVSGSPAAEENPHYARVEAFRPEQGIRNQAYEGIFMKPGLSYRVSFYGRAARYLKGDVRVCIRKDREILAESVVPVHHEPEGTWQKWQKYETELTTDREISGGEFCLLLTEAGIMEFDFVSMIPGDAVFGVFRKDLFDALKDLKPGFIRFPGGCVIEGNTLSNRYQWKKSVGPLIHRTSNWNRWAVHETFRYEDEHTGFAHYNQTLGIGYFEYFLLCELLHAKPLPVLSVGLACQFQSYEMVEPDAPEFAEYLQDALDLIEFANGAPDTAWGAVRASMGHPEPFNLTLLGIGNEQWETETARFFTRAKAFEKAIHEKYPDIQIIGSAGPFSQGEFYDKAWKFYREQTKENPGFTFAVDEHYYMPPAWFFEHADFYDSYDRNVKVFSGEYAAHPFRGNPVREMNSFEGALSEACFLTGVEKNSDVVLLSSYAPLFARKNYTQWAPDLIWFDSERTDLTPSYFVQRLYSTGTPTHTVDMEGQEEALRKEQLYVSLTRDERAGTYILKAGNAGDEDQKLSLRLPDGVTVSELHCTVLTAADDTHARETVTVLPFEGTVTLPKKSFSVIEF